MSFDYKEYPKKLNLGCGLDKKEGFVNVDLNDFHSPDLVCDVSWLKPLPDCYYDYILANDILEHIPRNKCENTLMEWNRALEMKGRLDMQVPNVLGLFDLLSHPEHQNVDKQNQLLRNLYGSQNYNGDFHFNGFTELTLREHLSQAGFSVIKIDLLDGWLFHVLAEKVEHKACDAMYYEEQDADFVTSAFLTVLQRDADDGGHGFYMDLLSTGICREAIVSALKDSEEYLALQD